MILARDLTSVVLVGGQNSEQEVKGRRTVSTRNRDNSMHGASDVYRWNKAPR